MAVAPGGNKKLGAALMVLGLVVALAVAEADYLTDYQFAFSVFYIVPVAVISWYMGRTPGLLAALAAGVSWTVVERTTRSVGNGPIFVCWEGVLRVGGFALVAFLLAELRRVRQRETRRDPVTGIPNSGYFLDQARHEIVRAQRYGHPFTMICIEFDNLDAVIAGGRRVSKDDVLTQVAAVVRGNIRAADCLARLGDEEFAILLPETGSTPAGVVLQSLHNMLSGVMRANDWPFTFSLAASSFTEPPEDVEAMLRLANEVLCQARALGRNEVFQQTFPA